MPVHFGLALFHLSDSSIDFPANFLVIIELITKDSLENGELYV